MLSDMSKIASGYLHFYLTHSFQLTESFQKIRKDSEVKP